MEEWRDVVGYEAYYQVSSLGRVRTKDRVVDRGTHYCLYRSRLKSQQHNKRSNYWDTLLCDRAKDGKPRRLKVHRLVAEAFIPNPDGKRQINHLDCNRLNNLVSNLEWATQEENMAHAGRMGRMARYHIPRNAKGQYTRVLKSQQP